MPKFFLGCLRHVLRLPVKQIPDTHQYYLYRSEGWKISLFAIINYFCQKHNAHNVLHPLSISVIIHNRLYSFIPIAIFKTSIILCMQTMCFRTGKCWNLKIFSENSKCYHKNHWTNPRFLCTHLNAYFMLNPSITTKILILKKIEKCLKTSTCHLFSTLTWGGIYMMWNIYPGLSSYQPIPSITIIGPNWAAQIQPIMFELFNLTDLTIKLYKFTNLQLQQAFPYQTIPIVRASFSTPKYSWSDHSRLK